MQPEHQAVLTEAARLVGQVDEIQARLSALVQPVVEEAIENDDPNKTYKLIQEMPRCVERTELRAHHINRLNDYEYRRRSTNHDDGPKFRIPVKQ